ncbi:MAG: hypothetical protein HOI95_04935 [Chromatiales bacterium]|nr:hypothetical protein [Chromatiales bacterium]
MSFALTKEWVDVYLRGDSEDGSPWMDFGGGAWCWLVYCVNYIAYNEDAVGSTVALQSLLSHDCSDVQLRQAVGEFARRCQADGHRAVLTFEHLPIASFLEPLGFEATDRTCFALRGPTSSIAKMGDLAGPPYWLDFL